MTKSRSKNAIINMSMSFLNQFTTLILSFVSRTIFIKVLGIELLGINGLFSDVLSLLSMADLGFNTAMVYSFYKPIADNDTKKISALINFYKKIYRTIAISITVIGVAFTPFIHLIVNTPEPIPLLKVYYLFALGGVIISYLFVYKTSIITADQKNYVVTRITIVINFIKTIIQIVSLVIFKNYILYLAINLIGNFLNNYIASKKAVVLYPYIKQKEDLGYDDKKGIFENIKSIFLYKLSSLLLNATDNTIISILVGTISVGLYSNYLLITNKLSMIIQIVFGSLTASIGNVVVKESHNKRYEIFKATQSISFIICGIVVSNFYLLVNDFIKVWLGEQYLLSNTVVIAITLNMYLSCILQPLWTYREATGLYVKTKYIMLVAAIVNLILSVMLGKVMGIAGVILASVFAKLTTYFWYEPTILFKEYFAEKVNKYYISIGINVILTTIIIVFLNNSFLKHNVFSWSQWFIKAFISGSITSILFILLYFKSDGFRIIRRKVKNFIISK
ncbi:hypothetical protein LQE93_11280 [Clostridium sp. NSJ-145]|uniref:lipopolysaccharide biosynthesis protein n=1 Tax=Clostridium sp. NSJ-145 TaxID=2897777 RepID=UPI001E5122B8|nr:hypothetical protein [Clostridium sp. NSJ-145]MCD2502363.1 hypothetical protein [Clostridium sp. NSJ-145]